MIDQDKPRICQVLGVEVGEPFDFGSGTYIILEALGGEFLLYYFGRNSVPGSEVLSKMIAHPDRIICKPRFTPGEVSSMAALRRMLGIEYIARDGGGELWGYTERPVRAERSWGAASGKTLRLKDSELQAVRPGQSVALADIVGAYLDLTRTAYSPVPAAGRRRNQG